MGSTCSTAASASVGDLDETFAGRGFITSPSSGYVGHVAIAVLDDSSVVFNSSHSELSRYTATGALDPGFGSSGTVSFGASGVVDVKTDPDNRLLVLLATPAPVGLDVAVARLLPSGELDLSYGEAGFASVARGVSIPYDNVSIELAIASDGSVASSSDEGVVKLTPEGDLDLGFGINGRSVVGAVGQGNPYGAAPVFRSDGRLLAVASGGLAQLLPNGALDSSFGSGGVSQTGFGYAHDIALGSDGSIYFQAINGVDQTNEANTIYNGHLSRLTAAGTYDQTFGRKGDLNHTRDLRGLVVDPQGRILVGNGGDPDFHPELSIGERVTRLAPDGAIDGTFGHAGTAVAFPDGCIASSNDIAVDPEGRIVIGSMLCDNRPGVVRLEGSDGPPDADADGVLDAADRCPLRFGDAALKGCPTVAAKVKITLAKKRTLGGVVKTPAGCDNRRKVFITRLERPGRPSAHYVVRTSAYGGWQTPPDLASGRYRAKVRLGFGPRLEEKEGSDGYCEADVSKVRRLR